MEEETYKLLLVFDSEEDRTKFANIVSDSNGVEYDAENNIINIKKQND